VSLENIYKNKKVLITGHTGFKGTWLCLWLIQLGAKVSGISLEIPSNPSHFNSANLHDKIEDYRLDIRDSNGLNSLIHKIKPDYVFHLAAQSLVRLSYEHPIETLSTNALGSANILDALRTLDNPVIAVMITSDKVYDNIEWKWGYRETDRLGGKDPYSASKGMAELAIHSFVQSFLNNPDSKVFVGIARAGNVIGGGDWALDRIVPDCMRAWSQGGTIRSNAQSPPPITFPARAIPTKTFESGLLRNDCTKE
jgi:CDP-glucose 4,6-dehydratase